MTTIKMRRKNTLPTDSAMFVANQSTHALASGEIVDKKERASKPARTPTTSPVRILQCRGHRCVLGASAEFMEILKLLGKVAQLRSCSGNQEPGSHLS
jgi:hypothetical protein